MEAIIQLYNKHIGDGREFDYINFVQQLGEWTDKSTVTPSATNIAKPRQYICLRHYCSEIDTKVLNVMDLHGCVKFRIRMCCRESMVTTMFDYRHQQGHRVEFKHFGLVHYINDKPVFHTGGSERPFDFVIKNCQMVQFIEQKHTELFSKPQLNPLKQFMDHSSTADMILYPNFISEDTLDFMYYHMCDIIKERKDLI
jgi:hypothetical protein